MKRLLTLLAALCCGALFLAGCGSSDNDTDVASESSSVKKARVVVYGDPSKPDPKVKGWDTSGNPINGGPVGADGSTGNNLTRDYCSANQDPACPAGSFVGPHVKYHSKHGGWDDSGKPVNGGPVGADGSTNNNLTQEYCAKNQDPGCPKGSYVAANAIKDPKGGPGYVKCEGTICTNPNHGAGGDRGSWDADGKPVNGGPAGADGSTGSNLTREYCAKNQNPACPAGSFVAPNAVKDPKGGSGFVKCEGTVCTNPNHGAGGTPGVWDADGQPANGGPSGADGSTGNNLSQDYCATNQDPACPAGSYTADESQGAPPTTDNSDDTGDQSDPTTDDDGPN
ncbi:hypothetical protein GOEFS_132_00400 [Gordonia effusa NBRC 100432]|uniref:Lipoprotein n=1 Tax=Gordonia effusa NBRC 100432 TaxID=1077974 RepID=H0R6V8_9ACTN|nr:hypothetical protein [Gordonia effusa]GAB20809.1 hypothetical protein GOEFS_132_00400 [Gordonia effusa NBRC 100432]